MKNVPYICIFTCMVEVSDTFLRFLRMVIKIPLCYMLTRPLHAHKFLFPYLGIGMHQMSQLNMFQS